MKKTILILFLVCNFFALYAQKKIKKDDLLLLRKMMAGSYSSEAQSKRDTTYYDVRLQIKPVWINRTDGYWFYVEQAMVKSFNKPYKQRVYHLSVAGDTCIVCEVYNRVYIG